MPTSMIIWFMLGFATWVGICIYYGEVKVADLLLAAMISITGPMLPLIVGACYVGIWLESLAKITLWKRRK